jgi:hypothetical protein
MIIGEVIWLAVQSKNEHSWPQSIFCYPFLLGLTSVWAQMRGELNTFWSGQFYDGFLETNYSLESIFGVKSRE